jgi:hypothetical protein
MAVLASLACGERSKRSNRQAKVKANANAVNNPLFSEASSLTAMWNGESTRGTVKHPTKFA